MNEQNKIVQNLLDIDFGDITGEGDPKLFSYFLNDNYFDKIINRKVYYVIGRKGTGKSAIYRFLEQELINNGDNIVNSDCSAFPFEKLLQLSDDNFSRPNQYQSIWKHIILRYFITLIATSQNVESDIDNIYYLSILEYYKQFFGNDDIVNLHKDIVQRTKKTNYGLQYEFLSASRENEEMATFSRGLDNITPLNQKLLRLLTDYFITSKTDSKYIIQFDRLDDNYNQYQNKTEYYHVILSLCKVVYSINQSFREKNVNNCKIIIYLRSDILRKLNESDAESARFSDFIFELKWAIINRNDWINSKLLAMINRRIETSYVDDIKEFTNVFPNNIVNLRNSKGIQDVFQYIVNRSFHRPRDVVKFCKCIQVEAQTINFLNFRTIKNAEKEYSKWFLFDELANEINPVLNEKVKPTYELLKNVGQKAFSLADFKRKYDDYKINVLSNHEDLLRYLYQVGIVYNLGKDKNGEILIRSITRNDTEWNPDMQFQIHTPIWTAINV